ncbi:MAG: hypothetical protein NT157_01620 [Candidatus Micrarchaeota archaeon]|nr:hypothetical protein [Candidatus Micrarchaeota archaeon]
MKKPASQGDALRFTVFIAAMLLLLVAPAAAQEQQSQMLHANFVCYFNVGSSYGECDAYCLDSCSAACNAAAAAAGMDWNNCGSVYPADCASQCASYFLSSPTADDGLPQVPQITDGQALEGPGITVNGETPESNVPEAGITMEEQTCPATAPDGHPMRWNAYLGCYDIYWKNDYCAQATTCNNANPCTGKLGCMWNGQACVPCTSPSCIFTCPGGQAPVYTQQKDTPPPARQPGTTPIANNTTHTTPTTPTTPTNTSTQTPGSTQTPPVLPTSQPPPSTPAQSAIRCGIYPDCAACANAPKMNNASQCGWADFLGACVDGKTWGEVNASGLKAGWVTEPNDCQYMSKGGDYCFEYADCFSCAGNDGIRRRCQWSVKDDKCAPYNPLGNFSTNVTPEGNDIILPLMCPSHDCSNYTECSHCEQNAICLWSRDEQKCIQFTGDTDVNHSFFFPGNCPPSAAGANSTLLCPTNCTCDAKSGALVACGGGSVNISGLVQPDRAVANAGAGSPLQQADEMTLQTGQNPTYVVRGSRTGAFLFVFPVTVPVTTTISARTGAVEKAEQPWWSFLAK